MALLCGSLISAQTGTVYGYVFSEEGKPVEGAIITAFRQSTVTDALGAYQLEVVSGETFTLKISHLGYQDLQVTLQLTEGERFSFYPVLNPFTEQLGAVVVQGERRMIEGVTQIPANAIAFIPTASGSVEGILSSLPGVSLTNELSSQYAVRGGNFDENLTYVNDIEVYRPFLIRSGEQEGLSFLNRSLVANTRFYPGGFPARFGDKLSSVLEVDYKNPTGFSAGGEASLTGGSAHLATLSRSGRFSSLSGVRFRDNQLLLNSRADRSDFRPIFADLQSLLTFRFSNTLHLDLLTQLAANRYDYQPGQLITNFGTIDNPKTLFIGYQGAEKDRYASAFGALKLQWFPSATVQLQLQGSAYSTSEEESFDLSSRYQLLDFSNGNTPDLNDPDDIGSERYTGNNELRARVFKTAHQGKWISKPGILEWGLAYTREDFRDQLEESQTFYPPVTDSLNPPDSLVLSRISARNHNIINRYSGFLQFSGQRKYTSGILRASVGLRAQHWQTDNRLGEEYRQTAIGPRAQLSFQPQQREQLLFRLSGGYYFQPPSYRELRDLNGLVQPAVDAQRSWQVNAGNDYSFTWNNRAFKLATDLYYKHLTQVNTYTLENVRIRYRANNNAVAYAYGADLRLYGEFVPNTESWVSVGYLKTEENLDDRGYRPRPTDQRLKFALLFQDYVPQIPKLRLYLNAVYQTGLPAAPPKEEDPYDFDLRLPSYKRADLGIHYVFTSSQYPAEKGHWLHKFKDLYAGFEIFNIFDNQNSITNLWVRDVINQTRLAVPNTMTQRVFNVKFGLQL